VVDGDARVTGIAQGHHAADGDANGDAQATAMCG